MPAASVVTETAAIFTPFQIKSQFLTGVESINEDSIWLERVVKVNFILKVNVRAISYFINRDYFNFNQWIYSVIVPSF